MQQRTTYDKLRRALDDDRIQEEARIANDLQRDHQGMTRSEALRLANELIERMNHGS